MEGAVQQPQRLSHRVRLTLFLVPMAMAFASAQVAEAIWPTLLTKAPWTLLAMSTNAARMPLVQPLVPAHVFFGLALLRPLLLVPLYFFFGRCYGDAALRWAERKLGPESKAIARVEHYFRRFGYALVAWAPNGLVGVMAGATRMRPRTFFLVAAIGTLVKVTLVYYLGDVFSSPLHDFTSFIGKYQWYFTALTFSIVAVQLWRRRRKNRLPIETVDEFQHELEDETELDDEPDQAATESTPTS